MDYNKRLVKLDKNNKPITASILVDVLKKLYVYESIGSPLECAKAIYKNIDKTMTQTNEELVKLMNEEIRISEIASKLGSTYEWFGCDKEGNATGGEGCEIEEIFEKGVNTESYGIYYSV